MVDIVHRNTAQVQEAQKTWYDRTARTHEFKTSDEVLVLLPTTTNKLSAQWQGPYKVLKKTGPLNYLIDMHDTRKRKRIFHVNMLKSWYAPVSSGYWTEELPEPENDEEDFPAWPLSRDTESELAVGPDLEEGQIHQLRNLLVESGQLVRLPPYSLPHACQETVRREIQNMLDEGIIQPSASEWAAPIMLVQKKDGMMRFCVDYHRLNTITRADAYPMPQINDLIDQLGEVKYISTLDLSRGYWQVPVAEEDQYKTAFMTPFGLYQFRVMPFRLCGAPATFTHRKGHGHDHGPPHPSSPKPLARHTIPIRLLEWREVHTTQSGFSPPLKGEVPAPQQHCLPALQKHSKCSWLHLDLLQIKQSMYM